MTPNQEAAQAIRQLLVEDIHVNDLINEAIESEQRRCAMEIHPDYDLEVIVRDFRVKAPASYTVAVLAEIDGQTVGIIAEAHGSWTHPGYVTDVKKSMSLLANLLNMEAEGA